MCRSLLRALLIALAGITGGVTAAAADCTCRFQGRDFELGQNVCLPTSKGARIATCGMVLNNTSWTFTETPCVVSAAQPESEPARAAVQHHHTHHRHGG